MLWTDLNEILWTDWVCSTDERLDFDEDLDPHQTTRIFFRDSSPLRDRANNDI